MQFSQIHAFLAVADRQSFSLAAEKLFITQPAVSKRISQLEESLGLRLFDRIGKKSLLTPDGIAFLPHAEQILNSIDVFQTERSEQNQNPTGTLTLATSHHIGLHRLPSILREFKKRFPQVDLDLHFMDSEDACAAIIDNNMEIAVVTLPESVDERLVLDEIWRDSMQIVLASDHSLAHETMIQQEQLLKYPAILPSQGTFTRKIINRLFDVHRERLKIILETNYLETIKVMVSANLGWSMLPVNMLDKSIVAIPLSGVDIVRPLGIVTLRKRTLSLSSLAMIDLLQQNREQLS
ncbi:MAG: DNA-binding transcriptional LysR family regulator [Gammaproteobacteria bacterium]|jgi:DNA-binding transcriptional LysR family regulator